MRKFFLWSCIFSLVHFASKSACGIILTYSTFIGFPSLYDFDTETGQSTLRCVITPSIDPGPMTYRPSDGFIYSVTRNGDLNKINPLTGAATFVGTTGINPSDQSAGLSFNPVTGDLYAHENLGGIFKISPTDASTISFTPSPDLREFSFDSHGQLYARGRFTRQLLLVNPTTGATTLVGTETVPGTDPLGDGEFAANDRLFGIDFDLDTPRIYETNPLTGAATFLGETEQYIRGLVYVSEPCTIALLLLSVPAFLVLRRSRC